MPEPGQLTFAPPRRAKPPRHLADMSADERRAAVVDAGEPAFRADQLSRHYFARHTSDPAEMTDLPAGVRASIAQTMLPPLLTPVRHLECDDGQTRKTLWRLFDGALVESVLMRYRDGRVTLCVSSQAGCGMNCPFCATGQAGLTRNMSAAEIVEQIVTASRMLAHGEPGDAGQLPHETGNRPGKSDNWPGKSDNWPGKGPGNETSNRFGNRISNVVFMGMGEPLANYKAVVTAVRRITDPPPAGLGIKQRGVTVSTVGLVPAIDKLAAEDLQVTLALSLHAPDDELRDELVPINTRWKVGEALDAAKRYFDRTGRRVSIEYALIRDVNDQAWRADLLGRLLAERRGRGPMWVHVNPIPLNPTPGSKWTASDPRVEREFVTALEAHRIPVTIRDTRGREIDGACGQLAAVDA